MAVGIHILNRNTEEITGYYTNNSKQMMVLSNVHARNRDEHSETFDFTVPYKFLDDFHNQNRVLIPDVRKGEYREFVIKHKETGEQEIFIQCDGAWLDDLARNSEPLPPVNLNNVTVDEAVTYALSITGYKKGHIEYDGFIDLVTTEYTRPYDLLLKIEEITDLQFDVTIETSGNKITGRYVHMNVPDDLTEFTGKELVRGKDITTIKQKENTRELATALLVTSQDSKGNPLVTKVYDDEARDRWGNNGKFSWDIYNIETNDKSAMTISKMQTIGKRELKKRINQAVEYEVQAIDIVSQLGMTANFGDRVRVRDVTYTPHFYLEATVKAVQRDIFDDDSKELVLGAVKKFSESDLRGYFNSIRSQLTTKLNDSINNVNTIIEQNKIHTGSTPPPDAVDGTLWYDNSVSDVAVLREYKDGSWINQTPNNVENIGGLKKEKTLYTNLHEIYENLFVEYSKIQILANQLLSNEYLVDTTIKKALQVAFDNLNGSFLYMKTADSNMTVDTATMSKLNTLQLAISDFRAKIQEFNIAQSNAFENSISNQKTELTNAINSSYANAVADAQAKVTESEQKMTAEISSATSSLSSDISSNYTKAITEAQNKVDAAKVEMNKTINDQKTALSTDINNSYTKAVSDAEIKAKALDAVITQTVNVNKQSADKTMGELNVALNSTSNKVGTIEENVTAAQQNISTLNNTTNTQQLAINQAKQDISGLTATVGGHTSSITNIDGQLTTVKSDLDKHAGDITSVKNATSSNTADISTLNNQIKLTATKTEVTDAISGIEIGGKNLIRNSNFASGLDGWTVMYNSTASKVSSYDAYVFSNTADKYVGVRTPNFNVEAGQTYTLTIEGSRSSNMQQLDYVYMMYDIAGVANQPLAVSSFNNDINNFTRISVTFTATTTKKDANILIAKRPTTLGANYNLGFHIRNVKLEKGNKATDYDISPLDRDAIITRNTADITIANDEIAKRVLKTDYDTKTGQMQTQINTATSTANKNTQTIATINGEIDSVKQWQIDKGTTIEQTADAITQKVWNTDISKATGTIQQELNTVKQTANSNSATISSVKTTADSVNTWKTQKESAINQTIDAVTTKVWKSDIDPIAKRVTTAETNISSNADAIKLTATKTEVQNAINNIEIGGRNLVPNSNDFKTWKKYSGAEFIFNENQTISEWNTTNASLIVTGGTSYGTHILKLYHDYIGGVVGETYTLSIYIKNNNGNSRILEIRGLDSTTGGVPTVIIPPNSINRYVITGKKNTLYAGIQTRILSANGGEATYTNMNLYGFKIEKGSKATDYTPAPEDIESKVTKNEASIQINSDEIIKRVTKTEFNTKTGQIEQTANTAKSTADSNTQTIATVKGNVDALSQWKAAKGTAIDQTINSVTNKAWLTDINPITKRVETAEASITTNANEIAKRVTKTTYDADTKRIEGTANTAKSTAESNTATITTVSGRVGTLEKWRTDKGSQIDQTIDAVTTKVWQNDIDALEIGGRNLLENSNITKTQSPREHMYFADILPALNKVNIGDTITISFDVEMTKGIYLQVYNSNQRGIRYIVGKTFTNIGTKKQRLYFTDVVSEDLTKRKDLSTIEFYSLYDSGDFATISNMKIEKGTKATDYTPAPEDAENRMTEIKQTADGALTKATTIGNDYVKQSAVLVQPDGVLIGSKKVSGTEMASAISVTPSNVDIITKVMRVTGDMAVAGDIKTLSLSAVNADIANLRAKIINADSVTATALKADTALINKLNTNALLTNYLTADTAMINAIKSNAVTAVRADIAWLKANVITADSITSTALKVDAALINKLNTNAILTNYLTADTAMINAIKSNSITAVRGDIAWLKSNVITADSITSTALKVDTALINKLNTNSILTTNLLADTAMINAIKSNSITAVRGDIAYLKSNIITADSVDATALKVDTALVDKLNTDSLLANKVVSDVVFANSVKTVDLSASKINSGVLNTSVITAKDDTGNLLINGDTITVKSSDGLSSTVIKPTGITIVKNGSQQTIDGLERGNKPVYPFEPTQISRNDNNAGMRSNVEHILILNGRYTVSKGNMVNNLQGMTGDCAILQRYTFFHEKRYLYIKLGVNNDSDSNLYFRVEDSTSYSNKILRHSSHYAAGDFANYDLYIDFGEPTFKDKVFDILVKNTTGANSSSARFHFRNMTTTNFKE